MQQEPKADLFAAWKRVDDRLAVIQERHRKEPDIPLYQIDAAPGASDKEIEQLRKVLKVDPPAELVESLRRWNGRWIAQDHSIMLATIQDYLDAAAADQWGADDRASTTFEEVRGPINPTMDSRRRICFGSHENSGTALFIDLEDPPSGGRIGQIIRIGEEPIAEFVAPSFVEFLNMVAAAPLYEDDPDFDPLAADPDDL